MEQHEDPPPAENRWVKGIDMEQPLEEACAHLVEDLSPLWAALCKICDPTNTPRWVGDGVDHQDGETWRAAALLAQGSLTEPQARWISAQRERIAQAAASQKRYAPPSAPEGAVQVFLDVLRARAEEKALCWLDIDDATIRLRGEDPKDPTDPTLTSVTTWLKPRADDLATMGLCAEKAAQWVLRAVREWLGHLKPKQEASRKQDVPVGEVALPHWRFTRLPVSQAEAIRWWIWNARLAIAADEAPAQDPERWGHLRSAARYVIQYDRTGRRRADAEKGNGSVPSTIDVDVDSLLASGLRDARRKLANDLVKEGQLRQGEDGNTPTLWEAQFAVLVPRPKSKDHREGSDPSERKDPPKVPNLRRIYETEVLGLPRLDGKPGQAAEVAHREQSLDKVLAIGEVSGKHDSDDHDWAINADTADAEATWTSAEDSTPEARQIAVILAWARVEARQQRHNRRFRFDLAPMNAWDTWGEYLGQGLTDEDARRVAGAELGMLTKKDNLLTRKLPLVGREILAMLYIFSSLAPADCLTSLPRLEKAVTTVDNSFTARSAILKLIKAASLVAQQDAPGEGRRVRKRHFLQLCGDDWDELVPCGFGTRASIRDTHKTAAASAYVLDAVNTHCAKGSPPDAQGVPPDFVSVLHHAEDKLSRSLRRSRPCCVGGEDCSDHPYPRAMTDAAITEKEINDYE